MNAYTDEKPKLFFIKTLLVLFVALELTVFVTLSIMEHSVQSTKRAALEDSETRIVDLEATMSNIRFGSVVSDILFLAKALEKNMAVGVDSATLAQNIIYFSEEKKSYNNIIFYNKNGEIEFDIAYDRANANAYLSPIAANIEFEEKEKSIEEGQVFVSGIYLKTHGKQVISPPEPEMRFSTPLYDDSGNFIGKIAILYNGNMYLNLFKEIGKACIGKTYLVNTYGYWLVNPDKDLEWGFMYGDKKYVSFAATYPKEWEHIKDETQGQFYTPNGLFTFSRIKVDAVPKSLVSSTRGRIVSHITPDMPEYGDLIEQSNVLEILRELIIDDIPLFIVIFIIAMLGTWIITRDKMSRDKIKFYSQYDAMTGLLNRRAGMERLQELFDNRRRTTDIFTLCFMDVNGLKSVNDTLGHDDGDELIKTVAGVILQSIRGKDFAARMGGDEFMLVLVGADEHTALEIWSRITKRLDEINEQEKRKYVVSVSCGMEELNEKIKTIEDMINSADMKMYEQKRKVKETLQIIRHEGEIK